MEIFIPFILIITGLFHIIPILGFFSKKNLYRFYGITLEEPNALILIRHRSVGYALLGIFMLVCAFEPEVYVIGMVIGTISVISFTLLCLMAADLNRQMTKVFLIDLALLILLGLGLVMSAIQQDGI